MEICFGFILLIAGIVWILRKIDALVLEIRIQNARRKGNWQEVGHLLNQKAREQARARMAQQQSQDDQVFLNGILALDAAEDGIFTPWGEEAVRRADAAFSGYSYKDEYDPDGMDRDEPRYDEPYGDWGPV